MRILSFRDSFNDRIDSDLFTINAQLISIVACTVRVENTDCGAYPETTIANILLSLIQHSLGLDPRAAIDPHCSI